MDEIAKRIKEVRLVKGIKQTAIAIDMKTTQQAYACLEKNASNAKRRAVRLHALPSWLTTEQLQEIKEIYKNCPFGYEVDHIIPLQGKNICGLHVPSNLQYLLKFDNRSKHNNWNPE